MLKKIISGAQSGADIAGIDAAIANNFLYGGWIPKGRRTEDGPLPEKYQMQEMTTTSYPKRTEQNVLDSDGTVIFTHGRLSGGSDLTRECAEKHSKPWLHLNMKEHSISEAVDRLRDLVKEYGIEALNVAGRSAMIEQWRQKYNTIRRRSSLGYKQPAPEAVLTDYMLTPEGKGQKPTCL